MFFFNCIRDIIWYFVQNIEHTNKRVWQLLKQFHIGALRTFVWFCFMTLQWFYQLPFRDVGTMEKQEVQLGKTSNPIVAPSNFSYYSLTSSAQGFIENPRWRPFNNGKEGMMPQNQVNVYISFEPTYFRPHSILAGHPL